MLAKLTQDIAYAFRVLRKTPGFTITAVLVIALGAGAVTTIYSAANALLLRPIPGVRDPGALVQIQRTLEDGRGTLSASYPYTQLLRDQVRSLSGVSGWTSAQLNVGVGNTHTPATGMLVTANYFDVLGVSPELGRFFVPAEDSGASAHPVAVISHGFWQRMLGGDPGVVGRVINVNGTPLTVVGVAPPDFDGTLPVVRMDLWAPLMMQPELRPGAGRLTSRNAGWLELFGRLRPGVSRESAQAEVATVTRNDATTAGLSKEFSRFTGATVSPLTPLPPELYRPVLAFFAVLFAIATLVLLIASVNVAGMLLARGIGRRRELAVRAALGAGRRRLISQLITETLVLYGAGAVGGIAIAYGGARLLEHVPLPADIPLALHLAPDARVLAFALGIALVAGLAFGLAPAVRATRSDLATGLRGDTAGSGSNRSRMRTVLVTGQVALSLLLLVSAGLFMRALQRGQHVDLGMDVNGVATAELNLTIAGYDSASGSRAFDGLARSLHALPGVSAVGYARLLPLSGNSMSYDMRIDGYTPQHDVTGHGTVDVAANVVDSGYFAAIHMPLVSGRSFNASDNATTPRVALVNQAFVHRYWPGTSALGRAIYMDSVRYTVVGVMHDAKYQSLAEPPTPHVFLATAQTWEGDRLLLVRTAGDPAALAPTIRRLVAQAIPNAATPQPTTLAAVTSFALLPQRVAAGVTGLLGLVGLVLAAVGLYGVISYSMSQRTREFGIRMALGANRQSVLGLVLGEGLRLVGLGTGIGLLLAFGVTRFLRPFLFGVSPLDPLTLAGMSCALAAIALLASYIPARRAASADPASVLRLE
jgi:predicted permease